MHRARADHVRGVLGMGNYKPPDAEWTVAGFHNLRLGVEKAGAHKSDKRGDKDAFSLQPGLRAPIRRSR